MTLARRLNLTRDPAHSRLIHLAVDLVSSPLRLWLFMNLISVALPLAAQTYSPPANNRVDVNLDAAWQFIKQDVAGAQATNFDDSTWTNLSLPHTWNNVDGEDGGNNYYRGIGWYRRHYTVDNSYAGRHFFLKFDGAFYVTDVYLNGTLLGEHQGGFGAFAYDATPYLNVGADNVIAVKVNNAANNNIPPLSADFTFFGGLYRDVHLLVTDPVQISPLDYASPGVYLKTTSVSSNSANLQVTTVVSNSTASVQAVTVTAIVTDAATNIVTTLSNAVSLSAASVSNIAVSTTITNPHLWNGLSDPYLYQTFVELRVGTNVTDVVSQPLGFRSFSVDPTNGFFLNGQHYDLHGVDMHQDWLDRGWAIGDPERRTNFMFLKEIGATFVRLSHYEHADNTYQLADQNGILAWSEIPLINGITVSPAFDTNTEQQLIEMIRQRYNHPAVVCWSLFNEEGVSASNLVSQLAPLAAVEDPTRPSTAASNQGDSAPLNWYSSQVAFNKYYGWYSGVLTDFAPWADNIHATYPGRRIGISEYGAGASIYQHSEDPVSEPANAGPYHPEEYQNLFHESYWQQMKSRPFLWCKCIWNMFDFASDGRNEGDHPGRNDKGLVTYDRQVRKDAFFWYKANWTTNPMVYITGHTFTNRLTNFITAKVYANCDSVEIFLNGLSQGSATSTNFIFTWPIVLQPGSNSVQAVGTKGATQVSDSLFWLASTPPPPNAAIVSPSASVVYLNSTNDTLQLLAAASHNASNAPPLVTTWSQVSGPGVVTFANSNALATTARFSPEGFYGVSFTANDGQSASAGLTVIVRTNSAVTNGLLAWWKMDESGGAIAADSSGNGRNATNLFGAVFTNGYLSNALHFNGTNNFATFASPDATQLTVTAWVKADSKGNSGQYPRILDTNPGYRLFFRFDGSGSNGLDFATYSSVNGTGTGNGDWFSGQNTISLGAWYHIAASYDRSSFANVPGLYVSGLKRSLTTISSPGGTQTNYTGTGYIGNQSATNRGWSGSIDDLRLYNRLLSDAEVQSLAGVPPANLAPTVNAGTNQRVLWPASASLAGTATDDGKPNPPGALTVAWSQLSGPGTATFANSNALATSVSFSAGGTYVLRLVADDGQVKTSSDVTVIAATRPVIALQLLPGALQLSWPVSNGTWRLQTQTNPVATGLSSNWTFVPGLTTNPYVVPIDPTAGSVFHRLVFTNQ